MLSSKTKQKPMNETNTEIYESTVTAGKTVYPMPKRERIGPREMESVNQ